MLLAPDALDIEFHASIEPLQMRWQALERTGTCSPFQTWHWVSALRDQFASSRVQFCAITASAKDDGRDLMLLPLVRERRGLNAILRVPDFGFSDYKAPLLSADAASGIIPLEAIWARVLRRLPAAGQLHLNAVPQHLHGTPNPTAALPAFREELYSAWHLTLGPGPVAIDTLFPDRLFRKKMRSAERKYAECGGDGLFAPTTLAQRQDLLGFILDMQAQRFKRMGRKPTLPIGTAFEFHSRVLAQSSPSTHVEVRALRVKDDIVAALYGVRMGTTFLQYMVAMDDAYSKLSPGLLLMTRTICDMHDRGCRVYDFSVGDEPYKRDFATQRNPLFESLKPLAASGIPAAGWYAARPYLVAAKRTIAAREPRIGRALDRLMNRT